MRMGSRTAAKANRNKAVSNASAGSKNPVKPGNMNSKQGGRDRMEDYDDLSVLRKSVGTSVNGLAHALKVFQSGTEEIRSLLSQECKLIYECRVCENLFRSLANFLSHKRIYCKGVALASHPSGSSPQPNGLLPCVARGDVGEGQSDGTLEMIIVQPEPPPKRQRDESPDHWICNESTPDPDAAIVGPLPKLESSVPPIRRRKDICGVIEKLSRRASRQNLANATAVASHFAPLTGSTLCLDNAVTTSSSSALYLENVSETKNAVYQTLLCASSSSMKLSIPSSNLEHSGITFDQEMEISNPAITQDELDDSPPNQLRTSNPLFIPSSQISDCAPSFPAPHNLLIKKRVAAMREAVSESERAILGPDGVLIPPKVNGPTYPPEVCSGGVSNSEGEEVEDDDDDDDECDEVSPKGKTKSDGSKGGSPTEDKQEIICSICKAKFSTRKTLTHHMKSLHVMFRTYFRCPCCKNSFANNWSVYRHLYKVHRKSTDQVRKMRALIKKKAFRKKILLPLPSSSSHQSPVSSGPSKESTEPVSYVAADEISQPAKQSSSSLCVSKMLSGPGRSGSPLPPPSEATQFPAISAQHAQVLRKLENIVKQEDSSWRLESFPERPGMGQSCPGCNRRFERRAALASHAHSCHKRILLAAQKASRARNKQQQQKNTKTAAGGKTDSEPEKRRKDPPKEISTKSVGQSQGRNSETGNGSGKTLATCAYSDKTVLVKKESNSSDCESESNLSSSSGVPSKSYSSKLVTYKVNDSNPNHPNYSVILSSKGFPDINVPQEKLKEEDWEEIERPNSASSFGTHRDSNSPLTIPTHPGRQQRIGIQIRKDYVKGDRMSVCSSGPSPQPSQASQNSKEKDDINDEVVILSSTFSKDNPDLICGNSKDSVPASEEACPDPNESNISNFGPEGEDQGEIEEKKELVVKLEDVVSNKKLSASECTLQSDDDSSIEEEEVIICEKAKESDSIEETPPVEGIIGPEVKRVFLEVIVGGVADPHSLTVDEEESVRAEDEIEAVNKKEKRDVGGVSELRTQPPGRSKLPSSPTAVQRLGGRPVRNRVKVEREDFIYDLSDMRLCPTKRDDANASSSHGIAPIKKPRRTVPQQQVVGGVSQVMNNVTAEGCSSVRHSMASVKVDGSNRSSGALSADDAGASLKVYSGKTIGYPLNSDKPNKVPVSASGSYVSSAAASHKMGDCRVVIGGLRSGDMTQLSIRRVYGSKKVLPPSNVTPVAVESSETVSFNSSKKISRSKESSVGPSDVDEGLFGEMSKGEVSAAEKNSGKCSSVLYQSDSLDSGDSVSDCSDVPQAKKSQ